jgi:hypothetical protein
MKKNDLQDLIDCYNPANPLLLQTNGVRDEPRRKLEKVYP